MYLLVAILEIGGTAFGSWKQPKIGFQVFEILPSNNPPSGISLFYFLIDMGCFFIYINRHKIAWSRLKNIRNIRKNNIPKKVKDLGFDYKTKQNV